MQGNWSQLTALRFAGNKHLGFPGHHSPRGVFHAGQYFLYKSNLSPLGRWDLSEGLQKTAQLPSGIGSRWAFLFGFDGS